MTDCASRLREWLASCSIGAIIAHPPTRLPAQDVQGRRRPHVPAVHATGIIRLVPRHDAEDTAQQSGARCAMTAHALTVAVRSTRQRRGAGAPGAIHH